MYGAEREVVGKQLRPDGSFRENTNKSRVEKNAFQSGSNDKYLTAPATDDAKKWDGWGTALKPAHEPIVVARKPLIGTVAQNVLEHGVGGLNIDATRIQGEIQSVPQPTLGVKERIVYGFGTGEGRNGEMSNNTQGRWPANIILDEYTAELLDEQSGVTKSSNAPRVNKASNSFGTFETNDRITNGHTDSGGASRFFYVAKASKKDRNEGLDELPLIDRGSPAQGMQNMDGGRDRFRQNFHPTVKPTALMQYLIRLVTPNNGVVLDPFAGSGSTGKAAILENKHFIGIELTPEYLPIIEGRLTHAYETLDSKEDLF
jgi:site-specific DNA-methyltransferase (adenine-specific)